MRTIGAVRLRISIVVAVLVAASIALTTGGGTPVRAAALADPGAIQTLPPLIPVAPYLGVTSGSYLVTPDYFTKFIFYVHNGGATDAHNVKLAETFSQLKAD